MVEFEDPRVASRVAFVVVEGEKFQAELIGAAAGNFNESESRELRLDNPHVKVDLDRFDCWNLTAEDLMELYARFGEINGLSVYHDAQEKNSFAIIEFAQLAVSRVDA